MSRIKDLKRELDTAVAAIEGLEADRAAGRLGADEHERERAERERLAGRLFVALRRAQREQRDRTQVEAPQVEATRREWFRNPVVLGTAAVLLVVAGVGGGIALGRWLTGVEAPPAASGGGAPGMSAIELQSLRQAAAREDAPTPVMLQHAHTELDAGRLPEARKLYERVLAREPKNTEAVNHLGAVLYAEGRVDEALAKVEEALRLDPRYVHAHWDRTNYLFYGKRDFPAAVKAGEAFLSVFPDGPDAENIKKLIAEARQQSPLAPKAR